MQLRLTSLAILACVSLGAQASTIYKWKDANGVTHYSDQPAPGSEKITVETPNRAEPSRDNSQAYASTHTRQQPAHGQTVADYTEFEIYAPADGATLNDPDVTVHIRISPAMAPRHMITLYLDGKKIDAADTPRDAFNLNDLPRGQHTLQAIILDRDAGESRNSNTVTFTIYQHSTQTPPRGPLLQPKKKP